MRLEVAVYNPCLVDIFESLEDLAKEKKGDLGLANFLLFKQGHQIFARKVLQDHYVELVLFIELLKAIDVRTAYQSQYLTLFDDQPFCA